ncbi:MAG TPA: hypothetical protein VN112_16200 [Ensifer sp.]|nr:hypothetical protein [Ensifer sp.]
MKLARDWKTKLFRHWSSYAFAAIGVVAFIPDALGYLGDQINIPRPVFLVLTVIGLICKVVDQELDPHADN